MRQAWSWGLGVEMGLGVGVGVGVRWRGVGAGGEVVVWVVVGRLGEGGGGVVCGALVGVPAEVTVGVVGVAWRVRCTG
ncbi:hypothetical protein Stsp01_24090 [Streptomyces sp. NBRC 13847]|nr:hypothetical protein Stsp01_24090 [Streptomyces sp. NBRC 13847]